MSKAFDQGYQAGRKGDMECPYLQGTQEYKDWWTGYGEARNDKREGRF